MISHIVYLTIRTSLAYFLSQFSFASHANAPFEPVMQPQNQTSIFVIPARRPIRQYLIPIGNVHGFSNVCARKFCGDFHIATYYKSEHSMDVIIRRLDQLYWDFNMSIFVQSLPQHSTAVSTMREVITVGPSSRSEKRVTLTTSISLAPDHTIYNPQLIPKTIIQTYFTRTAQSAYQVSAHHTFVDLNPEYQLKMFTDRDCRLFLRKYFSPMVLEAYDVLIAPTFKADLFRYAYLALRGGCYFDHKMILRRPLREVLQPQDTLLVCSDAHVLTGAPAESLKETKRLYNAVICSAKQEPRMWQTLSYILRNIYQRHATGSDLSLTGPVAFYDAIAQNITEEEVRFKHGFYSRQSGVHPPSRKYEDYFVQEKVTNSIFLTKYYKGFLQNPATKYGTLWRSQMIYYDLLGRKNVWKIYVYPGQRQCLQAHFDDVGGAYNNNNTLTLLLFQSSSNLEHPSFQNHQNSISNIDNGNSYKRVVTPSFPSPLKSICKHIKLYFVNDETSETYKMEIPHSTTSLFDNNNNNDINNNGVVKYTIPFSFAAKTLI